MEGVSFQDAFNAIFTLSAVAFGWILNTMWGAVKDMQKADREIADKVAAVEILVVGKFVPRHEFMALMMEVKDGLRRIEDKMDGKVDK
tara:strand:+ start:11368 stop:11631 length:264 start_codon:yes stop_codon:yes gene_type:complete